MLVKFVKLILTIPGLLKYFEIVIVVITEEPLKEKSLDFENLVSKFTNVFIVTKEICSPVRSPGSQRCVIFQSFDLTIFFENWTSISCKSCIALWLIFLKFGKSMIMHIKNTHKCCYILKIEQSRTLFPIWQSKDIVMVQVHLKKVAKEVLREALKNLINVNTYEFLFSWYG